MCLVALAVQAHPAYPLVVIANRDERYDRPSEPAREWSDAPQVFGGRDLEKGGTWLGVTRAGRFAALTNVRSPSARRLGRSRGELVRDVLLGPGDASAAWRDVERDAYPAFNLLFGDGDNLFYATEAHAEPAPIEPGVHALSNARLDVPWPKVEAARRGLGELLADGRPDVERAFSLLASAGRPSDVDLPDTGVPRELERALSPAFIVLDGYGTRASTVVLMEKRRIHFHERSFGPGGVEVGRVDATLELAR